MNNSTRQYWEIALPEEYKSYGHFTMDHQQILCCDGYFKFLDDVAVVREYNKNTKGQVLTYLTFFLELQKSY